MLANLMKYLIRKMAKKEQRIKLDLEKIYIMQQLKFENEYQSLIQDIT